MSLGCVQHVGCWLLCHLYRLRDALQEVGLDAIKTALEGINATIIAYGQTGAGKTHTLAGETLDFNRTNCPVRWFYISRRHAFIQESFHSSVMEGNDAFVSCLL